MHLFKFFKFKNLNGKSISRPILFLFKIFRQCCVWVLNKPVIPDLRNHSLTCINFTILFSGTICIFNGFRGKWQHLRHIRMNNGCLKYLMLIWFLNCYLCGDLQFEGTVLTTSFSELKTLSILLKNNHRELLLCIIKQLTTSKHIMKKPDFIFLMFMIYPYIRYITYIAKPK